MRNKPVDWVSVVQSLIDHLRASGCTMLYAVDGERERSDTDLAECVCSCDEGWLIVDHRGAQFTLWIVLGNEPFEIVADYSVARTVDKEVVDSFDAILEQWSEGQL